MAAFSDELNDLSQLPNFSFGGMDDLDAEKRTTTSSRLHCCVPMCNGDSRYNKELSFHRFPKSAPLRAQWIVKIKRDEGPYFKVTDNTRVCSQHFTEADYRPPNNSEKKLLIPGAVPTLFKFSSSVPKQRRKILRQIDSGTQTDESEKEEAEQGNIQSTRDETSTCTAMEEAVTDQPTELDLLKASDRKAQEEIEDLKAELAALKIHKFGLERFSSDNDSIRFYTGFPTYEHLCQFYEFIAPSSERMINVHSSTMAPGRPGARNMLLIDELFLFLVRIRLGLFEQDLAHRFVISTSSVSRKVTTWANYLYFLLGTQTTWASREQITLHMPKAFREKYPTTRVILDCTELYVQTPPSLLLQSQLYSTYKSNTPLKGLIGIAPHGAVTFVSSLYTGSISDREITRCSGILDLLEENDSVMADKGFDIEDLLSERKVKLNIPPFLQSKGQFSVAEVQETKNNAKLRIHVERAIRRLKEYHIFDGEVPLNMLGTLPQVYTVICLLTNFQGGLIMNTGNESDDDAADSGDDEVNPGYDVDSDDDLVD